MRPLGNWRTALRIAYREARRAKARSALIMALIGLPVLGLSFAAVSYDTFRLRPDESIQRTLGAADAQMHWGWDTPVRQNAPGSMSGDPTGDPVPRTTTAEQLTAALPPGSRVLLDRSGRQPFRTAHGRGVLDTRELAYTDPIAAGILRPLAGRAPASPDEVALTPGARERLGVGLGGNVSLADGSRTWRVVGLVEDPQALDGQLVVLMPGAYPLPALTEEDALPQVNWLVDTPTPIGWPAVRALNDKGILVLSREVLLHPEGPFDGIPPREPTDNNRFSLATAIGGSLVLEVVLLAGPAFAMGTQRRRRDMALVAAAGGTPRQLRRIVLADGVLLGAVAATIGLAAGALLAWLTTGPVAYVYQARPGAFRLFPTALAGLACVAVGAGVLAALVPAWMAGRVPVTAALSGRYATARVRRRWAVLGVLSAAGGAALVVYGAQAEATDVALFGLVAGQLGLVLCTPALVALIARLGGRLWLPVRIALRDAGRNRSATASAISAVLGAVAVSAMIATLMGSAAAQPAEPGGPGSVPAGYAAAFVDTSTDGPGTAPPPPPPPEAAPALEKVLRDSLPAADVVPVQAVTCGDRAPHCVLRPAMPPERECPNPRGDRPLSEAEKQMVRRDKRCVTRQTGGSTVDIYNLVVAPEAVGRILKLDRATRDQAENMLRSGGVLLRDDRHLVNGYADLLLPGPDGRDADPAQAARKRVPAMVLPEGTEAPALTLTPATVTATGLGLRPNGFIVATSRMPTEAERDRLVDAAAGVPGSYRIVIEQQPYGEPENPFLIVLSIVAGVIALGAAAIATGLAASESRADLSTLGAVGASPIVRTLLSVSRMGLIAGLGSVLGVLAGVGGALALITGSNRAAADAWPPTQSVMPVVVPWENVLVSVLVVPAVAVVLAALCTRAGLPIERRR